MKKPKNMDTKAVEARTVRFGGAHSYSDIDRMRHMAGEDGEILRAIWGASQAEFDAGVEADMRVEALRRRHVFVQKYRAAGRKRQRR